MEKFCVFCGQFPESKNKEHVLPEWLIKMTGDPKRIATFGVDFAKQPFAPRQFSFDALTFPACSECNSGFSHLETATKPIVHALLSHQAVSASDLILLLDWLDKVRVGLWLGYFYLDKNPLGITPSFHIQNRVGHERGMPVAALAETARLDGIKFASTSRLNQAFRTVNPLPLRDDTAQQILNLWHEIEHLQFWCYVAGLPIKVDLRDGARVYEWLLLLRERMRREQEQENSSGSDTEPANNVTAQG